MDKFREALRDSFSEGYKASYLEDVPPIDSLTSEIASRYGPMLSPEEVRGMLEEAIALGGRLEQRTLGVVTVRDVQNRAIEILSRHTEGEQDQHDFDETVARLIDEDFHDTPTIKAGEIERLTGEKVPEWARWISTDFDGLTLLSSDKPELLKAAGGPRWIACGSSEPVKGFTLPELWSQALRRIIRDEPETRPAPSDQDWFDGPPNIQYCGECHGKHRPDEDCFEPDLVDPSPYSLDREVGEIQGELVELTRRVAAIEKRLLADGHSERCALYGYRSGDIVGLNGPRECTCHYDEVREGKRG